MDFCELTRKVQIAVLMQIYCKSLIYFYLYGISWIYSTCPDCGTNENLSQKSEVLFVNISSETQTFQYMILYRVDSTGKYSYSRRCIICNYSSMINHMNLTKPSLIIEHESRILQETKIVITYILHYSGVIMSAMASQIASVSIVCSTFCSGAEQEKTQSPAPLGLVRGFPSQRSSDAANGSIWWRHHDHICSLSLVVIDVQHNMYLKT